MRILKGGDQSEESLQTLAKQVHCHFKDMTHLPSIHKGLDLPILPETALKLIRAFYDQKVKGLLIAKKPSRGPNLTFLGPKGVLWIPNDRVAFSIVVPYPEGVLQRAAGNSRPVAEASHDNALQSTQQFTVGIGFPLNENAMRGLSAQSRRQVAVGDVLVLEQGEEVRAIEPWGITLLSVVHVIETGVSGQSGWKELLKE